MGEERRVIVVSICESAMHLLFREGAMLRCIAGVPSDAILLGVHTDWSRRSFDAMFEHPSFPICPHGREPDHRQIAWEIVEYPCDTDFHPRYIGTDYNEMVIKR